MADQSCSTPPKGVTIGSFARRPRTRQQADVAGRLLEHEVETLVRAAALEKLRRRGDEDEIDVVLGREQHGLVPGSDVV